VHFLCEVTILHPKNGYFWLKPWVTFGSFWLIFCSLFWLILVHFWVQIFSWADAFFTMCGFPLAFSFQSTFITLQICSYSFSTSVPLTSTIALNFATSTFFNRAGSPLCAPFTIRTGFPIAGITVSRCS